MGGLKDINSHQGRSMKLCDSMVEEKDVAEGEEKGGK